jgi:penicillin amidase
MSTISRDKWGISHVKADSAANAFEAQGWVAADDRIWQMEWDRRRALGRWSEVVGSSGAMEDAFFRRLGLAANARSDWNKLSDEAREMTQSYADGVNRWLESHGDSLPKEFDFHPEGPEAWEPWHCVAVYKVRHIFMGTLHRKLWRGHLLTKAGAEITRAFLGDPNNDTAMMPSQSSGLVDLLVASVEVLTSNKETLDSLSSIDGGSNSWALDGSRTASGLPLLAGDPHRTIEFPNVYHQFHMQCPEFDAIGMGFPGVPAFPHFGHNPNVAWCITHGMADDTDLFVETTDLASVEWRPETLKIRDSGPVEVWCGSTERGPVVLGDPADGVALSIMWTGISGVDTTFEALSPMLKSESCQELESAVKSWVIPVNNLLSADIRGNISFKVRGRVVERNIANRWTPVAGIPANSWNGAAEVSYEGLQGWRNPKRGFLVTANNRISDGGPYISLDFAGPARHDRIVQLLSDMSDATVEDMKLIHRDVKSLVAPELIKIFRENSKACTHVMAPAALDLLNRWDCEVTTQSVAASIYNVIRRRWAETIGERLEVLSSQLGAPGWPSAKQASRMLFESATEILLSGKTALIPGLETPKQLAEALSSALDESLTELQHRYGPEISEWQWGRLHRMASPHPLAEQWEPARDLHPPMDSCPGDGDTVRCGSIVPETGERSAAASVARYVYDLADWDNSGWVVPHGVSGVRASGHDLDQRVPWLSGELVPMLYSDDAIKNNVSEVFTI